MKLASLSPWVLLACTYQASAVVISMTAPTGGQLQSGYYVTGAATGSGVPNWPAAEGPAALVNTTFNTKYLNFGESFTGAALVPGTNASVPITQLTFYSANDAPERDPTSYLLFGSNTAFINGTNTADPSVTLISSGSMTLPTSRNVAVGDAFSTSVTFTNTTAYTNYLIIFPTVRNGFQANSMQIGEVVFEGTAVPEVSSSALLAAAGVLPLLRRRKR